MVRSTGSQSADDTVSDRANPTAAYLIPFLAVLARPRVLVFDWLALRQEKIGEVVAAHAASNAPIAVYVLAFGQCQLW